MPISVIFVYWLWVTFNQYLDFGVRYRPNYAPTMTLRETGKREIKHILRRIQLAVESIYASRYEREALKRVYLYVNERKLGELNARLPSSGYHYVKGGIINNGEFEKVKLRYRGDFPDHWANYKKSFRIKTKKNKLYEGMRKFNLIVPDIDGGLNNYFGYQLAKKLDLIAPKSEMVELIINGKRHGLYLKVEQLEELTLRRHGKMPGDLYAGELVASDGYFGSNNYLTEHPGLWKKVAINNHYEEASVAPLQEFLSLIRAKPSRVNQERLAKLLDIDAWGAFLAFTTLAQTFHYDEYHNWRLYFDPAVSKFVPVIWDPDAWSWHNLTGNEPQFDIIVSPIYEALYQNTEILQARNRVLRNFFVRGNAEKFLHEVSDSIKRCSDVIRTDPNLPDSSPDKLVSKMRRLSAMIKKTFTKVQYEIVDERKTILYKPDGNRRIAFEISGMTGVKSLSLQYQYKLTTPPRVYISYKRDGGNIKEDVSDAVSYVGSEVKVDVPLLGRYELEYLTDRDILSGRRLNQGLVKFYNLERLVRRTIRVESAYYELEIEGVDENNKLLDVSAELNSGDSANMVVKSDIEESSFGDSYPVVMPRPSGNVTTWSGVINIKGITDIYYPVYVMPGTKIYMNEGAMLRFHSRVIVKGKKDMPVMIIPEPGNKSAWGAFVLMGKGSNGSNIEYCIFEGGSGVKDRLYEYSGMLSIHDVSGVSISHSVFRNNAVVDDMVHAVYSDISIKDSTFENSLFDALDIDISRAEITGTEFYNSGNDAIDLMASKAIVKDSVINGSGDKGISVGEGSHLLAVNSMLSDNAIGIQSKDSSVATVVNSTFKNNMRTIDAYKKNWRYDGGGDVFVYKSRISGRSVSVTADKNSDIYFVDSYIYDIAGLKNSANKHIHFHASNDGASMQYAANDEINRLDRELQLNNDFGAQYWDYTDSLRRGASINDK